MEQKSFYSGIKVQSPSKSITTIPATSALPAIPLSEVEQMENSSSSTYSQKMLHSIYHSSIPPLPIPKYYQKECNLSIFMSGDIPVLEGAVFHQAQE